MVNVNTETKDNKWVNLAPARDKLLSLFGEIIEPPGFGELRVDVKALRNGQKEVVLSCGKKYRFILKPVPPNGGTNRDKPVTLVKTE